jgi:hypothetical protein
MLINCEPLSCLLHNRFGVVMAIVQLLSRGNN